MPQRRRRLWPYSAWVVIVFLAIVVAPKVAGPSGATESRPSSASASRPVSLPALDAAEADRYLGGFPELREALRAGELAEAFRLVEEQRSEVGLLVVRHALARAVADVDEKVREGRILEASARCRLLIVASEKHEEVKRALEPLSGWFTLADSQLEAAARVKEDWLPEVGRVVRLRDGDAWREGRVVIGNHRTLTVVVDRAGGLTYPIVDLRAVEPVDASVTEALAMAAGAERSGDSIQAKLWLAYAARR